jgi:hypothetical protein
MKYFATVTLMLTFGAAAVYAYDRPVKLTFSGSGGPSSANLQQPNSITVEENVVGKGTLGSFTFRNITAQSASPETSSTCSGANLVFLRRVAGGGILRFADGSLMKINLVEGGDCIDFAAFQAHCTLTLQINGGTGRFKNASGTLTYTETAVPVVLDASNNPVLGTEVGEITGTISGVSEEHDQDGGQ